MRYHLYSIDFLSSDLDLRFQPTFGESSEAWLLGKRIFLAEISVILILLVEEKWLVRTILVSDVSFISLPILAKKKFTQK